MRLGEIVAASDVEPVPVERDGMHGRALGEHRVGAVVAAALEHGLGLHSGDLTDQIAADEMACSVLADEILEAIEKVELLKKTVPPAEEEVVKAQAELNKTKGVVNDQAATIKSEIIRLEAELKTVEATLPADMRDAYERAVKSMGDGALAPADGDTCTGCNRQFTTNMLSDLMMGRIVFCKSCGALLYLPEDTKTAKTR